MMQDATMITFDVNGTLVDSKKVHMAAFIDALYEKAKVDPIDSGMFYAGKRTSDYTELFNDFLKDYGNSYPALVSVCPQDFSDAAWELQRKMPTPRIYDDVLGTLESLKDNVLYAVSRAPRDILETRLEENGIMHYFSGVRSVYGRSDKEREIHNIVGAPYGKKIFVGDEEDDMKIVKDYNAKFIGDRLIGISIMRPDEWNNRDPVMMRKAGADHVIGNLYKLADAAHAA